MITIRMTHYSTSEKKLLEEILAKAAFDVIECDKDCESCRVRNLCGDLQSALAYVLKQRIEAK